MPLEYPRMSAPPRLFETTAILAAYRETLERQPARPDSPLFRLAEALDLLAAGEDIAADSKPAPRPSQRQAFDPKTFEENPLSQRLLLIVEITAREGQDEALVGHLVAMENASRAEPGCREYTMLRSLSNPARFVVYEIWESAEALEAHRHTPHYLAFGPAIFGLVSEPPKVAELPLAV